MHQINYYYTIGKFTAFLTHLSNFKDSIFPFLLIPETKTKWLLIFVKWSIFVYIHVLRVLSIKLFDGETKARVYYQNRICYHITTTPPKPKPTYQMMDGMTFVVLVREYDARFCSFHTLHLYHHLNLFRILPQLTQGFMKYKHGT